MKFTKTIEVKNIFNKISYKYDFLNNLLSFGLHRLWKRKLVNLLEPEILLTSMDGDGTQNGYDLNLTESVANIVDIPVIASGGAGSLEDIYDVFKEGRASAALLASLLHDKKLTLKEIKTFLLEKKLSIRPYE